MSSLASDEEPRHPSGPDNDEEEDSLSDWEKEVETEQVFYLKAEASSFPREESSPSQEQEQEPVLPRSPRRKGLSLSRLVRRRESKRERSASSKKSKASSLVTPPPKDSASNGEEILEEEEGFGGIQTFESLVEAPTSESLVDSVYLDFSTLETVVEGDNLFVSGFKEPLSEPSGLRIGDWIRLIEGQRVTIHNVESILRKYRQKSVKLTFQRELRGGSIKEEDERSFFLSALYLTQRGLCETSGEGADILYCYPPTTSQRLLRVRGIAPTLASACPQVTGSGAKPLLTSLLFQGGLLVHLGIFEETEEDTFILSFPDNCLSLDESPALIWSILSHLRFRFGTLREAFSPPHRKAHVDAFFQGLFHDFLGGPSSFSPRFTDFLPLPQLLVLPDDVKFQVDDALSQFESGDFMELTEDFYDSPREFDILGSILFHRGYLLASHLPREETGDITLWLKFNNLLKSTREKKLERLVVWQQVHNPAYGKLILLLVGTGHQVLGALLESSDALSPDPFYVDHADNTLDHLSEMGIPLVCEKWLSLPHNPDIIPLDRLYEKTPKDAHKKEEHPGVVLKRTRSVEDSYYSSNSSETSDKKDDSIILEEETSTAFREESSLSSRSSLNRTLNDDEDQEQFITYRVSSLSLSRENTIFHFIQLDFGDGIFLSPLERCNDKSNPLHKELLLNIRSTAQIIHSSFALALRNGDLLQASESRRAPQSPWLNRPLVALQEQGVLFTWSPTGRGKAPLNYWVVGRLLSLPGLRETYVCYLDSTPQNMIELAFRLSIGVGL